MGNPVRVDLINHSNTLLKAHVTTNDKIKYREMLATGDATLPDGPAVVFGPGSYVLDVPAGKIFGFASGDLVSVTPGGATLEIIQRFGKDPWPQPPPFAPTAYAGLAPAEYALRFRKFNTADAVPDTVSPDEPYGATADRQPTTRAAAETP